MPLDATTIATVKGIVCRTLEIQEDQLGATDNFVEAHGADSLRMIEVLAGIERELEVNIDQTELASMIDLGAVLAVVERHVEATAA